VQLYSNSSTVTLYIMLLYNSMVYYKAGLPRPFHIEQHNISSTCTPYFVLLDLSSNHTYSRLNLTSLFLKEKTKDVAWAPNHSLKTLVVEQRPTGPLFLNIKSGLETRLPSPGNTVRRSVDRTAWPGEHGQTVCRQDCLARGTRSDSL